MTTLNNTPDTVRTLRIVKSIEVAAPIEATFAAVLEEMGPGGQMPDGGPFPRVIEPRPGGRWYRDLGNDAGHFWGHVQVIKPPKLLEVAGPLFMSYPAINHLQYRLAESGRKTQLQLTHRAMGLIPEADRTGMMEGWDFLLQRIVELATGRA